MNDTPVVGLATNHVRTVCKQSHAGIEAAAAPARMHAPKKVDLCSGQQLWPRSGKATAIGPEFAEKPGAEAKGHETSSDKQHANQHLPHRAWDSSPDLTKQRDVKSKGSLVGSCTTTNSSEPPSRF